MGIFEKVKIKICRSHISRFRFVKFILLFKLKLHRKFQKKLSCDTPSYTIQNTALILYSAYSCSIAIQFVFTTMQKFFLKNSKIKNKTCTSPNLGVLTCCKNLKLNLSTLHKNKTCTSPNLGILGV